MELLNSERKSVRAAASLTQCSSVGDWGLTSCSSASDVFHLPNQNVRQRVLGCHLRDAEGYRHVMACFIAHAYDHRWHPIPPNLEAPHSATGIIIVAPTLSLGGDVVHHGDSPSHSQKPILRKLLCSLFLATFLIFRCYPWHSHEPKPPHRGDHDAKWESKVCPRSPDRPMLWVWHCN